MPQMTPANWLLIFLCLLIFMMIMFTLNSYFIMNMSNYKMIMNKFKNKI